MLQEAFFFFIGDYQEDVYEKRKVNSTDGLVGKFKSPKFTPYVIAPPSDGLG